MDLVPAGFTEKRPFFLANNPFFSKKKNTQLIFIWKKGTFLFAQFFPVVGRTLYFLYTCIFYSEGLILMDWASNLQLLQHNANV